MVTFSIISRLFSIYFLFMGRRKRTYKITSIIVQAGDEVADFKLDSNEDFEIPKNQINKIMNNMKKQIDSIIESKNYNTEFSNANMSSNNQYYDKNDNCEYAQTVVYYNNINVPIKKRQTYQQINIEIKRENDELLDKTEDQQITIEIKKESDELLDKTDDEILIKDIIPIKKRIDYQFDEKKDDQLDNIVMIANPLNSSNDEGYLKNQEKTINNLNTPDFEGYLTALNKLFEVNNQSK